MIAKPGGDRSSALKPIVFRWERKYYEVKDLTSPENSGLDGL